MSSYRKSRKKDWLKTLIYIAIYLTVLGFTGIYLFLSYWYVWIALAAGGLLILISWHAKATAYHCPRCGYEFEISLLTDFFNPHGVAISRILSTGVNQGKTVPNLTLFLDINPPKPHC